jgi:lipid-A-disaccharide synthase
MISGIQPSLFIFAGEQSGDLHGSHLMKALKKGESNVRIFGVGGPAMRSQGMEILLKMEEFEVMGFTDVILSLPKLWNLFYQVLNAILVKAPQVVLLIDYPGFNLRLAKGLRKRGFKGKIVQYVSPTVWAHGKKRIKHMAETLDLLLTILPFEPPYFAGTGLKAIYVGNPLQEYIKMHPYCDDWKKVLGIPVEDSFIALFPGSRQGEVKRNLPAILEAAEKMKKEQGNVRFVLSCAHASTETVAKTMLEKSLLKVGQDIFFAPKKYAYEMMRDGRAAVAKSGTVTLELALHHCPTVVIYKLTWLNRLAAKWILRLNLSHYALANILAGRMVFPELIEHGFSSGNIYTELKALFEESSKRKACLRGCKDISALLKEDKASQEGALIVEELLSC